MKNEYERFFRFNFFTNGIKMNINEIKQNAAKNIPMVRRMRMSLLVNISIILDLLGLLKLKIAN